MTNYGKLENNTVFCCRCSERMLFCDIVSKGDTSLIPPFSHVSVRQFIEKFTLKKSETDHQILACLFWTGGLFNNFIIVIYYTGTGSIF